ncbi:hypothetical protein AN641_08110 [Candidatus Epulonipiscioides gigas]|nr:hypothetical protein AN641_08110 [Epulopiscium sp. SCG-C07WGA-EpuloA2]
MMSSGGLRISILKSGVYQYGCRHFGVLEPEVIIFGQEGLAGIDAHCYKMPVLCLTERQEKSIHPLAVLPYLLQRCWGLEQIPNDTGQEAGTPWTGRQSITGLAGQRQITIHTHSHT